MAPSLLAWRTSHLAAQRHLAALKPQPRVGSKVERKWCAKPRTIALILSSTGVFPSPRSFPWRRIDATQRCQSIVENAIMNGAARTVRNCKRDNSEPYESSVAAMRSLGIGARTEVRAHTSEGEERQADHAQR